MATNQDAFERRRSLFLTHHYLGIIASVLGWKGHAEYVELGRTFTITVLLNGTPTPDFIQADPSTGQITVPKRGASVFDTLKGNVEIQLRKIP